ncbi:hypothetical protein BMON_1121 [Bifidobacterium mongoliense DSM 21395]|uniref:Uncharacterized protein n=1 Tax=Bifidobacterium mongoliense DSM 21395 TaxID=1437603 RepID=A0A087BZS4_9BIFI|nr:hypothetical protein BMON_1121 [Bifidobacterium mongoliense DSM 21395]
MLPYRGPFNPYLASDKDIEDLLLFTQRREILWNNFLRWRTEIKKMLGDSTFWVNGSFVTTKPDPEDIDVVVLVSFQAYKQANISNPSKLSALKTIFRQKRDGSKERVQPYGGLIDSFIVPCDNIDKDDVNLKYWDRQWSGINESKHYLSTSLSQKGFLEVR